MCKTDQLLLHNFRIWKMVDTGWEAAYEKNAVLHTGCHHVDGAVRVRAEAGGDKKVWVVTEVSCSDGMNYQAEILPGAWSWQIRD